MTNYAIAEVGPRQLGATGFWKLAERSFGKHARDPAAEHHLARVLVHGTLCADLVEILWFPKARKAQLSFRGRRAETSAASPRDAVERFFGLGSKKLAA